jgi:hypothetical protein
MKKLVCAIVALGIIGLSVVVAGPFAAGTRTPRVATQPADAGHDHGTVVGLAPAPITDPAATAARLVVTAQPFEKTERGYALQVNIVAPDGKPVADAQVKFYELVDLFGTREMLLAAATTDGRGAASYGYLPAHPGSHPLIVRFTGRDRTLTAGEGRLTLEATVSAERPAPERSGFAAFSDKVPYAAGALVLTVWGLIAFALIATARGVIGAAPRTSTKGETA